MRFPSAIFILILALISGAGARAQRVSWDPPGGSLAYNQVSQLTLVFENCEPDDGFRLSRLPGLELGTPNRSEQSSFSMTNGNMSSSKTVSLSYPARPTQRSRITIPAFEVATNKGRIRVPAASFEVGAATVGRTNVALDSIASARFTPATSTYWAGEVFPLTYTLSVTRRYFNGAANIPDWTSAPFTVEEWSKPEQLDAMINGDQHVNFRYQTRAYAKTSGEAEPASATQAVNLVTGSSNFGFFFQQPVVEQRVITSNRPEFTIRPLPEPAPADFHQAVGDFTFTSKVVPATAAVGEPVTWTVELAGTGNWPDNPGLPARDVSKDFQVIQPQAKRVLKEGKLFDGTLSEDIVLVPTKPGTYTLGPLSYSFFDPKAGSYQTVTTDPVTVTVTAAKTETPNSKPETLNSVFQPSAIHRPTTEVPEAPRSTLPRDPLPGAATGLAPLAHSTLVGLLLAPFSLLLPAWFCLAARRAKTTDPRRPRREARAQLEAILRDFPAPGENLKSQISDLKFPISNLQPGTVLRRWQHHTAAFWQVVHAAPGAWQIAGAVTRTLKAGPGDARATAWESLWTEAEHMLYGRGELPADWLARAKTALNDAALPAWSLWTLFLPRNLLPFLFACALMAALAASPRLVAETPNPEPGTQNSASEIPNSKLQTLNSKLQTPNSKLPATAGAAASYRTGDFAAAEKGWRETVALTPSDWHARHNLALALAQQDRWPEAATQWTSAFLLHPGDESVRWHFALGMERSGFTHPRLAAFAGGSGFHRVARLLPPGGWQWLIAASGGLAALAAFLFLRQAYRRGSTPLRLAAGALVVIAGLAAATALVSLDYYGPLAEPDAVMLWRPTVMRSIPTEADTTQKTENLPAGTIAVVNKTFLGWVRLAFPNRQTGWVRKEDVTWLYR